MKLLPLLLMPLLTAPAYANGNWDGIRNYNRAKSYMDMKVAQQEDETRRRQQPGWSEQRTCFKSVYREEYIPGTQNDPGYVKSYKETVEVDCEEQYPHVGRTNPTYRRHVTVYEDVDTNDCSDGTVAGALLGGGLAGFGSRGKDRWWAIPTGILGGAMVGCQIDGG